MLPVIRRFLANYAARHQHPGNQLLHVIGLPATFVVPVILLFNGAPLCAAVSFLVGYLLQFAGHAIEGNDAGEVILVKKIAGRPYIDVVRRGNRSSAED